MAKGKLVDKKVVKLVRELLSEDAKLTGKELQDKVKAVWPDFTYSKRTYQKMKKDSAGVLDEIKVTGHDEPWSLGTYARESETKRTTSSKDNLAILRVRKMQIRRQETLSQTMSVRQALWIARLRAVVDDLHSGKGEDEKAWWLWMYSFQYAIRDKVSRLKNEAFSSRELDDALAQGHEKFKEAYEKDVQENYKEYERFYASHFLDGNSEYRPVKDGEK